MNKEKTKTYLRNVIASVNEKVNYIAYCPICESYASVIDESERVIRVECSNYRCPMGEYILTIDKIGMEFLDDLEELKHAIQ